jgi:hypothetical protein
MLPQLPVQNHLDVLHGFLELRNEPEHDQPDETQHEPSRFRHWFAAIGTWLTVFRHGGRIANPRNRV